MRGLTRNVVYLVVRHPFAFEVNTKTISEPKVYKAVCASHAGTSLAMVCYTTRVDSRIPQDSSGSPRTSHDSLVRSARRTRERHIFVPTPLSKSWDDHVTWRSPTTIRPALWGVRGVPHRKFQQTFRRGHPRLLMSRKLRFCT